MTVDYARSSAPVSREATWYSAPAPRAASPRRRSSDRGLGQNLSGTLESGCIAVIWSVAEGSTSGVWLHVCRVGGGSVIGPLQLGAPGAHCDVAVVGNGQGLLFALWRGGDGCMRRRMFDLAEMLRAAPASEQRDGALADPTVLQALLDPDATDAELQSCAALLDSWASGIGSVVSVRMQANGIEA
jgi:hypothetical protein